MNHWIPNTKFEILLSQILLKCLYLFHLDLKLKVNPKEKKNSIRKSAHKLISAFATNNVPTYDVCPEGV